MIGRIVAAGPLLAGAALVFAPHAAGAAARPPVRLSLSAAEHGERTVESDDLRFVFHERIYYQRRAPRSQVPGGRRVEVRDKRHECRCLRLADWTKIKFKRLKQIDLDYPPGQRRARLRLTRKDGRVVVVGVEELFGYDVSLAPRFTAGVDGAPREFPLALSDDPEARWPEEALTGILLAPPPPERRPPARRPPARRRR